MLALAPWNAAAVKMMPRIGPAHGAHSRPVAMPSTADDQMLSFSPGCRSDRREPSATSGRVMRSEMDGKTSAIPNSASRISAAQRPIALARTAQPPPTAARVATIAKVAAMPTSIGSVLRAKAAPGAGENERQHRQDARADDGQNAAEVGEKDNQHLRASPSRSFRSRPLSDAALDTRSDRDRMQRCVQTVQRFVTWI